MPRARFAWRHSHIDHARGRTRAAARSPVGFVYGGGENLGHPTPNIDRIGQEGAVFTSWYGQASCTAGRASFMTGRIPIRSALSVVVVPGDENGLTKSTPTIAEFFQKNGYGTYFSGKWHLGDQPKFYPTEHGFDEMKEFAAYYPGVYPPLFTAGQGFAGGCSISG